MGGLRTITGYPAEDKLAPYRKAAEIEVYKPTQYGMLAVTDIKYTHRCKLPRPVSRWHAFLNTLLSKADVNLHTGNLWRCDVCGDVYMCWLYHKQKGFCDPIVKDCIHAECLPKGNACYYWAHSTIQAWVKAGGIE